MRKKVYPVIVILCAVYWLAITGCHKRLESLSLDQAAGLEMGSSYPVGIAGDTSSGAPSSMVNDGESGSVNGSADTSTQSVSAAQAPKPSVVPYILRFIPESQRKFVFDELTLRADKIWFLKQKTSEVFVSLNADQTKAKAMAQARYIGSSDGLIVILSGIRFLEDHPVMTRVFTFEYGRNLPRQNVYLGGKQNFLNQFAGQVLSDKTITVDGITGATPLWKPVAVEIEKMSKELQVYAEDVSFIASLPMQAKLWDRAPVAKTPSPPAAAAVVSPNIASQAGVANGATAETDNSVTAEVDLPSTVPTAEMSFENMPELSNEMISTPLSAVQDWPMTYWKVIGWGEINLLILGLLIVLYSQLRKDRRS